MNKDKAALKHWVDQLGQVELPSLSTVMKEINTVTQASDSSASQLSEIILQDAGLTRKVLKVANSAYHNATGNEITTISRAVVQLGFKGIKAISLSVLMIDSLMKKDADSRERMLQWLARGFHAAVQAESLIGRKGRDGDREDVFIAALLQHMGEMAFWCSGAKGVAELDRLMGASDRPNPEAERQLLGVTLADITRGLAAKWQIDIDFSQPELDDATRDRRRQAVRLGDTLSMAAEQGWESDTFNKVLVEAALFSGLSLEQMRAEVERNAERAATIAVDYGANKVCSYIPNPGEPVAEAPAVPTGLQADAKLQLDVLREMGAMVAQNVDANTLFQMVVEGIHRGIGLERVALCLADPGLTRISAKYVLGNDTDDWREHFSFPVGQQASSVFSLCLQQREVLWLRKSNRSQYYTLYDDEIKQLLAVDNALMAAIFTSKRSIGLIVADRGFDGNEISQEQQESFSHFIQQTNMSLEMLAAQRARAGRQPR